MHQSHTLIHASSYKSGGKKISFLHWLADDVSRSLFDQYRYEYYPIILANIHIYPHIFFNHICKYSHMPAAYTQILCTYTHSSPAYSSLHTANKVLCAPPPSLSHPKKKGVGIPFFIAGVVLFCGCFVTLKACCCHRSLPPKDSRVREYVDG